MHMPSLPHISPSALQEAVNAVRALNGELPCDAYKTDDINTAAAKVRNSRVTLILLDMLGIDVHPAYVVEAITHPATKRHVEKSKAALGNGGFLDITIVRQAGQYRAEDRISINADAETDKLLKQAWEKIRFRI